MEGGSSASVRTGIKKEAEESRRVTCIASLRLHSEMIAEDRRLRPAGYEVYCFGGWELTDGHQ